MKDPFVIVDLETTGIDSNRDQIIQIAMLRVEGGLMEERSYFVNPHRPVSDFIRRLTGFHDVDFSLYPNITEIRDDVLAFIGSAVVVGHNVDFDVSFLARAGIRVNETVIDTLQWARIAFPTASSYRLSSFFPEDTGFHDARYDVHATYRLMQKIIHAFSQLPTQTQRDLDYLLGAEWQWWQIEHSSARSSPIDDPHWETNAEPEPLAALSLALTPQQWLESDNPSGNAFKGLEVRPSQRTMMEIVQKTFSEHTVALIEAGTGTGKSLAYLIPSIFRALEHGERIVISTHTVALQDQLWQKDLPQARQDLPVRSTLLKGRGRYLCLLKADSVRQEITLMHSQERWFAAQMLVFIASATRGDLDDFNTRHTLSDIVADRHACAGARCPYAGPCFMRKARRDAENSHLVIVNHSLLAAHLANEGAGILPSFQHIVVDEAHHLHRVVEKMMGFELDVEDFMRRWDEMNEGRGALLVRLSTHPDIMMALDSFRRDMGVAKTLALQTVHWLSERVHTNEYDKETCRVTAEQIQTWDQTPVLVVLRDWGQSLKHAAQTAQDVWALAESVLGEGALDDPIWLRFEQWAEELVGWSLGMEAWPILDDNWVSWWEVRNMSSEPKVVLRRAPLDVAPILHERLWNQVDSGLLTSATLSINGNFKYMAKQLGLEQVHRKTTMRLPTPFNVPERATVLIPDDMVDVKHPHFINEMSEFVLAAVLAMHGRSLVLLTSHKMLRGLDSRIRTALLDHGVVPLVQGIDGASSQLVPRFRLEKHAVLMGTASLWEGVDIPGDALSLVIIGRLPFLAPGDPLEEARQEGIQAQGRSAFFERSLPEAILRFQQGFGRLLRTSQDRGLVAILDQRIIPGRTQYGTRFISALPRPRTLVAGTQEILQHIHDFQQHDEGGGLPGYPINQR